MKKKIGILTSIGIGLSNIVYGTTQMLYGIPEKEYLRRENISPLYALPSEEITDPTFLEILQKIGKIAIIPVILIIGVVVIVKINKKNKSKKIEKQVENDMNTIQMLYGPPKRNDK